MISWPERALKDKMRHSTLALHDVLPQDYRTALALLREVAPMVDRHGFEKMIFPDFVEVYGLDDWDVSLPALEQFTQQMSAEFAVRPFIVNDQARMMAQMFQWAHHASPAVRRLATEGCRPRLPWAMSLPALKADPSPILPILDALKADSSEDVRRSVANNLNDISKDHPDMVIDVLRRWQTEPSPEIQKIVNHALRTLIKAGHPDALRAARFQRGRRCDRQKSGRRAGDDPHRGKCDVLVRDRIYCRDAARPRDRLYRSFGPRQREDLAEGV